MNFNLIENQMQWERLILSRPEANFLQSWHWGEFHQRLGKQVLRAVVNENDDVKVLAQAILEPAKRGAYLAIAGGPLFFQTDQKYFKYLLQELGRLGRELGAKFVRFRPQIEKTPELMESLAAAGYLVAPMHLTADLTIQLDLTQELPQLLQAMRKNTRYEIKKAEKLGIYTTLTKDVNQIAQFYQHQLALAQKHGFIPFGENFLKTQFEVFAKNNYAALIHAHLASGQLLASAFVIFYNKEAVYHYGISTAANQKQPGSYACQWRSIQEAKNRGCTRYNLWGVAPKDKPHHRFAGVSIFKRGFGGQEIEYLPAHDLPLTKSYLLTRGFETLRKLYRKL